ncbi:MAG TPA: sigma-54 dependent transcriptional regulator [Candidatus Krumholzibacteria bacterium]|nr:sigma-54 dependent transcriptional regulator [Candidatus Krumholzibacteria bacterium]
MSRHVLIVDDEKNIRRTFGMVLGGEGFAVSTAESGEEALALVKDQKVDLVVLDVRLPGIDGIETLRRLRELDRELPVIMISGHATIATAVEATRVGAYDFVEKPLSRERLLVAVRNAVEMRSLGREVRALRAREHRRRLLVGESAALRAIREQIAQVAPTGARVLITGESGTGKELVARAIHDGSERARAPFVKVNCAAIPEELIESELFGAVKGAYTGATQSRDGRFLQADKGTLFLDEIGDMSLKAQAKVLRALQEGEIERVGSGQTVRVDVRVLAATNKDLAAEARAGRFREDLFFRLNVVPVQVPPLRDRRDDIPLLAEHFLSVYLDENGLPPRRFAPEALQLLRTLPWPGNIRELGNAVERLAILARGTLIGPDDLARLGIGGDLRPGTSVVGASDGAAAAESWSPTAVMASGGLVAARQEFEKRCVAAALDEAAGNVSQAARLLGIDRTNLHKKIAAYGLTAGRDGSDD